MCVCVLVVCVCAHEEMKPQCPSYPDELCVVLTSALLWWVGMMLHGWVDHHSCISGVDYSGLCEDI